MARLPFVEERAKRRDLKEEISLLDRHVGPDGGQYLIFRNDIASSLDQDREKIERARTDRDRREGAPVVAPEQPAARAVKAKVRE